MLKQVTHMLAQRVINRQNRFGLGLTHRLGLLEQIAYWARVDLVLEPGGFREEARQVGLIGTVEDAAGDVGHALIGKYHKASQIVLKMSKGSFSVETRSINCSYSYARFSLVA